MQKLTSILGVALFGALLIGPLAAQAGEAQAAPQEEQPVKQVEQKDPASLQKEAYSKFVALRASMEDLRKQLAERDESKAERIKRGLRLVQEAKLSERMGEVRDLLEEASWDEAISKMTEVQTRLNQLMLVLLDRDDDLSDILERIETLDAFKKRVDELLDQQRKERDASVEAERLAEQLDRIQQAKQRVNKLLDQQSKLRSDTQQQGAGDKPSEDLAKRQDQLEKDAKDLAGELREIEQAESDMDKGGAPSEGKPTEGKPGEGKPAEGKPGEGKPSEGEGSEGGKPSSQVGKASESMGKSGQKLEQNKPEDSLDDQEKAIEDLKAAQDNLKELEEEARRRLMELPFEKMEKDQLSTKQKTDKLAEDMEDAETGGEEYPAGRAQAEERRRLAQGDEAGQGQAGPAGRRRSARGGSASPGGCSRAAAPRATGRGAQGARRALHRDAREATPDHCADDPHGEEAQGDRKAHAGRADPDLGPRTLRQAGRWRALARRRSGFGPAADRRRGLDGRLS
jgi:hypothetical protein